MSLEDKTEEYVEEEAQSLALFVHGGLFSLHVLGIYYNMRKGRYIDAGFHTAVAVYDLISAIKHKDRRNYLEKVREGL